MSNSNKEKIQSVLKLVDREIWIVTAASQSRRGGLVATWVSQASIDPDRPVVVVGIAPNHFTADLINESESFVLHLLCESQTDVAWNFALGSGRDRDKFEGVETHLSKSGSPVLRECLAWCDCRVFSKLETGDRTYYWADVLTAEMSGDGTPLKEKTLIRSATDQQMAMLRGGIAADLDLQRPGHDSWRNDLPAFLRPN